MKRLFFAILAIVMPVHLFPVAAEASAWSIRLAGALQINGGEWKNWYTIISESPDHVGDVSSGNGIQGVSLGFDALLERRISDRFVLGLAAGFVPTRLHAEVHHTEEQGIVIEKTKAHIAFYPVRLTVGFDVLRLSGWTLQAGVQGGVGVFGTRDVRPAFGRARHFYGGARLLGGLHVAFTRTSPSGWGYSIALQHFMTSFKVEELGTGEFQDKIRISPTSLLAGVHYSFPASGK